MSQRDSKKRSEEEILQFMEEEETASPWLCDSCRQVDIESNKYTNNCQGAERDKASDGGAGGKGDQSGGGTEKQSETQSVLLQSGMLLFIWWLLNK